MIARSNGQEVQCRLVRSRRDGEEVVIGDPRNPYGIVKIASIKGERVRLAFDFPRHIDVHRREVADLIAAADPTVVGTIRPASGDGT